MILPTLNSDEPENAQFRCAISVSEDDDVCQCFTVLPSVVPEDKRLLIAEVCIRASYGMKIGSFEFDMDDGEIRFHAAAPYPTGNLDDAVIRHLVSVSLHVPDRYYPAFMSVLFAGVSPNDAVFAVEQKLQDKLNARVSWGAG